MNFCSECGKPVTLVIPKGDDRERYVCSHCDTIHYQNPNIIAGTLPVYGDQVLLCLRAIEPRKNYWTLPAGFMENHESLLEAARRETREEALTETSNEQPYISLSVPHISQVYFFYLAELATPDFGPGDESLETRLFREHEIPWDDLAFPTIARALQMYFDDVRKGSFPPKDETISV